MNLHVNPPKPFVEKTSDLRNFPNLAGPPRCAAKEAFSAQGAGCSSFETTLGVVTTANFAMLMVARTTLVMINTRLLMLLFLSLLLLLFLFLFGLLLLQ